jgi:hypothetical protein
MPVNKKYDPADFIVPAKDTRGESARVWCRIQPGHDRALDVLLNSRRFPFRTKGDIVRWAVARAIRSLEQMEDVPSVTREVDTILDIVRQEQWYQEYDTVFTDMGTVVSRYLAEGDRGEATRMVAKIKARIDAMEDGHWRSKYMATLVQKYGHLLVVGSGAAGGNGEVKPAVEEKAEEPPKRARGASLRVVS